MKNASISSRTIRPSRLLEEEYCGRDLAKALIRKFRRRLMGPPKGIEAVAKFGDFIIFDRADLRGGGLTFGQDYLRVFKELGLPRCKRLFEFCAGPGYIGYLLLLAGHCEHLVLADINPLAIEAARRTAAFNGCEQSVSLYLSGGLKNIPTTEQWDVVVGNPPHFEQHSQNKLLCEDSNWRLHADFYSGVKRFLSPGARVILQEYDGGSSPGVFEPMILAGGGNFIGTKQGPVFR